MCRIRMVHGPNNGQLFGLLCHQWNMLAYSITRVAVWIVPNEPLISACASIFGSNVSWWLMPPSSNDDAVLCLAAAVEALNAEA